MTNAPPPHWLVVAPHVSAALEAGQPVLALESTVLTHGLPRPANLELARNLEADVRARGVQPATIAVVDGRVRLGLSQEELMQVALAEDARKVSTRDLGAALARGHIGGTTVAATIFVAHAAGIRLVATGGIGGIHPGATGDVSADLPRLAHTPVAVVCSGAKSILDLPRTLEYLETASVPVIGWRTEEFPAFFSETSGLPLTVTAQSAHDVASILEAHWEIGLPSGALICVPCPADSAVKPQVVQAALTKAEEQAAASGVRGKALTPFILERLADETDGATLRANLALLRHNALIGADISRILAA